MTFHRSSLMIDTLATHEMKTSYPCSSLIPQNRVWWFRYTSKGRALTHLEKSSFSASNLTNWTTWLMSWFCSSDEECFEHSQNHVNWEPPCPETKLIQYEATSSVDHCLKPWSNEPLEQLTGHDKYTQVLTYL